MGELASDRYAYNTNKYFGRVVQFAWDVCNGWVMLVQTDSGLEYKRVIDGEFNYSIGGELYRRKDEDTIVSA